MIEKPLLSICIPTYEREEDLYLCLDAIKRATVDIKEFLEVCISDNRSSYDFLTLCKRYERNKNFIFEQNSENLGVDFNIVKVLSMARGDYAMLLGNDDILDEIGIIELIKIIKADKPDAVFSNYQIQSLHTNIKNQAYNHKNNLNSLEMGWVLSNLKIKFGFISSITLSRGLLKYSNNYLEDYNGTTFIHIAFILDGLKYSKNISYMAHPIVSASDKNMADYNVKEVFMVKLDKILKDYESLYPKKSIKIFKESILKYVLGSGSVINFSDIKSFRLLTANALILFLLSKLNLINSALLIKKALKKFSDLKI